MQRHANFAIVCFYVFLGIAMAMAAADDPRLEPAGELAWFSLGVASTLWWIADASVRRVPLPYLSLWIGYFWAIVIPTHYLSTRGWRGIPKLLLHIVIAFCIMVGVFVCVSSM